MNSLDLLVLFKLISNSIQVNALNQYKDCFNFNDGDYLDYLNCYFPDYSPNFQLTPLYPLLSNHQNIINNENWIVQFENSKNPNVIESIQKLKKLKLIATVHNKRQSAIETKNSTESEGMRTKFIFNSNWIMNYIVNSIHFWMPLESLDLKNNNNAAKEILMENSLPISFASPFLYKKIIGGGSMPCWLGNNSINSELSKKFIFYPTIVNGINCNWTIEIIKQDWILYHLLCLLDSVRLNNVRESKVAKNELKKILDLL